jgi:uncharacterized protein YegP (UPF0339 family)
MNVNSGKCFDVSAGNTANGSDVSQFTYTPSCEWQQWKITYCGNGDYTITDMHSGKLLSVEGSSSADNANAWIWQQDGTAGQYFRIRKNSDGTYTFLSKCSGYTKALGVYNAGTTNGDTVVQQSGDNGSANQKYYIFVSNTATYNIQNVNNGKSIEVSDFLIDNNYIVEQTHTWLELQSQKWRINYIGDGNYIFVNSDTGKLLTMGNNSNIQDGYAYISSGECIAQQFRIIKNTDGTFSFLTRYSNYTKALSVEKPFAIVPDIFTQETYNSNSNSQKFNIILSQSEYHIKNFNSDKCLDVSAGNTGNGSDVAQFTYTPTCEWQRWQIKYCGNGDYKIIDMHSGKLLSVEGSSSANNANIWIWQQDGTAGQYFRIRTNADGTVTFLTKASNYTKAIGIYNSGLNNGDTVVQQSNDDGSDNQKFVLIPNDIKMIICASGVTLDNALSSSWAGHSWIEIHNTSSNTIDIGRWTIEPGRHVTVGRWGKDAFRGLWYNREVEAILGESTYYEGYTYISKFISYDVLAILSNFIHSTNSGYDLYIDNCTTFAVDIWNLVGCGKVIPKSEITITVPEMLTPSKLAYPPQELVSYIENNFEYEYGTSSTIFDERYYGYYKDSENVFYLYDRNE